MARTYAYRDDGHVLSSCRLFSATKVRGHTYGSREGWDPRDSFLLFPCAFHFAYDADFHPAPPTTSTTTTTSSLHSNSQRIRAAPPTPTPPPHLTRTCSPSLSHFKFLWVKHIFDTPFRPFSRVFLHLHDIALTLESFIKRTVHIRDVHGSRRPLLSNHPSPFPRHGP